MTSITSISNNMKLFTRRITCILKYRRLCMNKRLFSSETKPPWKIAFFGTDKFSVPSLEYLNIELKRRELISTLEVVTSNKAKFNPVRAFAQSENLPIHGWPTTIENNAFDLGIVVSFGHLIHEDVIKQFDLGIINVHASLLPRWRGAAPIIYTIANEDTKTGVTIMKIQPDKFDIGEIIAKKEINIPENVLMPDLYEQLAVLGASTLMEVLRNIPECLHNAVPQPVNGITYAPKVTPNMAKINWDLMTGRKIYALSRALHGLYPLSTSWNSMPIKLYEVQLTAQNIEHSDKCLPGTVEYQKQNQMLLIKCVDQTWLLCFKIGILGKKPMSASDFNNGYLKKEPVVKRIFK